MRISEEEYGVLTLENFNGDPDLDNMSAALPKPARQLQQYFGFPFADPTNAAAVATAAANMEKVSGTGVADGIHEFLRRTGIKYTDLVELIKTKFINPHQHVLEFIQWLFAGSSMNAPTIYSKLQQIKSGALDPSTDAGVMLILTGKIHPPPLPPGLRKISIGFNAVITLYQSSSGCDLDKTFLKTILNVYANTSSSGVASDTWSRIHRFIRLWRKLGWKIHEVDLMLAALGENDITATTISKLSYAVILNKQLNISVNNLAALWGNIDTYGDQSLYKKLFLNKAVRRIDTAFQADAFGKFLADPTQVLQDHLPGHPGCIQDIGR